MIAGVKIFAGRKPAIEGRPARADWQKGPGGINRAVSLPAVKAEPEGPPAVCIVIDDWLTPADAREVAARIMAGAQAAEDLAAEEASKVASKAAAPATVVDAGPDVYMAALERGLGEAAARGDFATMDRIQAKINERRASR